MKQLLVVVDMQVDFVTGALGTREAQGILPAVQALLAKARQEGYDRVFTQDTHGEDYLSSQEGRRLPVKHCIRGSRGWQLMPGLHDGEERIFEKPTFGSKALAQFVQEGGYDRVTLCGVCTDICVVSNALLCKAFCPETEICVAAKACAGSCPAAHEAALQTMQSCQIALV